jgi:glycosyltransferase involved in cell wall biosynthesis
MGAAPDRVSIQSVGANIGRFRSLAGDESQVPGRLLFVGRLVEKKGVGVLLDALRLLPDDLDWSLEIAGDGPLRDELEARAAGLPVTFAGQASREWLARAYVRASVVVVPSVPASSGDQDGLPTVLLEGMGAARAAVASDLPGINEAITDDESGLLVPPGDPVALADALRRVLTDDVLRKRLGEAAAERSNDYTVEACAARFAQLLTAAAGRTRR